MPFTLSGVSYDVPGVYISENTFGAVPASLVGFNSVYMLGYSTQPGAPTVPTFIQSVADFVNTFGTSESLPSVQLFFDQRSGAGIWFVPVPPKAKYSVTIPTATLGATYSLTIDGLVVSYTAMSSDSPASILAGLAKAVNTTASHSAYLSQGNILVDSGIVVTPSANVTLGALQPVPSYPVVADVIRTINTVFDGDMRQGFLIAPEFFKSFTVATDRQALAGAMEALASDPNFNWVALIDCGLATATTTTGNGGVNLALAQRSTLSSPKGHSYYYFPYWVTATGQQVPPSASVAGVALRRFRAQGYRQPAAGIAFPVYGVVDTTYPITDKVQAVLNPQGVNCIRNMPAGRGQVVYGARSLSTSPYYKFITTRVILNVLEGSLTRAFDDLLFTSVDGQGELFARIKGTCVALCETLRLNGALYGSSPEQAYLVVCDETNNTPTALEAGQVSVDVVVKPSPMLEVLSIRVSRASIGSNLTEIASSGDLSQVKLPTETIPNSSTPKAV